MSSAALAGGRGSMPAMHWCHECAIEMRPLMTPGPTCPRCNGEFVEEIDLDNPITSDDVDEEDGDEQMIGVPRPFAGAEGSPNQNDNTFGQPGMDLGSLVGSILRGLASAGSEPRPATGTSRPANSQNDNASQGQGSRGNGNVRTGTNQSGPISFSWGVGSYHTSTTTTTGAANTFAPATSSRGTQSGPPLRMHEFLRRSFPEGHHHDDGMGGAGGAADGRFFNSDNRDASANDQGRIDDIDEVDDEDRRNNPYPPEMASIRDVFANLFGGMGDGPAGMLMDMFGGGQGRTGDYVWGQQGLDDVITQLMEQTRGSTAPPPASEEAIRKLERFSRRDLQKVRLARNRECTTCMDSFEDEEDGQPSAPEPSMDSNRLTSTYKDIGEEDDDPPEVVPTEEQQDELMMMPCKHLFHLDCLLPWLQTNGTCPVCRVSLATDNDNDKSKGTQAAGGESNVRHGEPSAPASVSASGSADQTEQGGEEDDESPEMIRQRSRRAAEARMAGRQAATSSGSRQTVPGSYLQPDELD